MNTGSMENISLVEVLKPQDGMWDYALYVIIILQVILLALLFNGSLRDVMLMAAAMIAAVADKIYLFGFIDGGATTIERAVDFHTTESFYTYVARVMIFAFPLVITTQTRIRRAKPLCIIIGIAGLAYVFGRWFVQQRPEGVKDFRRPGGSLMEDGLVIAHAGTLCLLLVEAGVRRWLSRRSKKS